MKVVVNNDIDYDSIENSYDDEDFNTKPQINNMVNPISSQNTNKRYVPLVTQGLVTNNNNSTGTTIYYQMNTKNKSFMDMHHYLKLKGIKNNMFHLILFDKDLANVDPFDPNLPTFIKQKVFVECQRNFFYYIREVVRVQSQGGPYVMYKLDRGNLALNFCFTLSLNIYEEQPRQTGKTMGTYIWYSWVYNFGSRNANMIFLNKKLDDSKRNLDDMKKVIQALPSYLRFDQAFGTNGKKLKARNTVQYMQHAINFNKIQALPGANSKTAAISLLRGRTITNCWLDESAFFMYLEETLQNAMPALTRAFANCKANGAPHGLCLTSTPGFISDDWGKYMYDLKCEMTPFSELWYDMDIKQLTDILNSNERSIFVYIRTTYQQLGYSEEWFKNICKQQNYKWTDIKREYLLEWAIGVENSPFTKEQLDIVEQLVKPPKKQIYLANYYLFNIYEELEPRTIPIIGADVSAGYKRDSSALSVTDSNTSKLVADFNCNYISTVEFTKVIYELVTVHMPNALVVIERNGVGAGVVARLVKSKIKRNLYFEIKERVTEERSNGVHINKTKQLTKVYGLDNTKNVREELMDLLMLRMEYHKDKFVSPIISEELKHLEVKKTGKIDHSNQSHDDAIFSYLLSLYPLYYGKNIKENWNIDIPNLKTEESEAEEIFQNFEGTECIGIINSIDNVIHNDDLISSQLNQLSSNNAQLYNEYLSKRQAEDREAINRILSTKLGQQAYANTYNIPIESVQAQNSECNMVSAINNFYETDYDNEPIINDFIDNY